MVCRYYDDTAAADAANDDDDDDDDDDDEVGCIQINISSRGDMYDAE